MGAVRCKGLVARLAVITVVATSGCVSSARYPGEWAPIDARPPACTDLSGVYSNAGTAYRTEDMMGTRAKPETAYLAGLFFKGEGRTLSSEQAPVRLRLDATVPGRLAVVAVLADDREVPISLSEDKDEFACREGRIALWSAGMDLIPVLLSVGSTRTTHVLSRASDGALIVESHEVGLGTVLVAVPIGLSERYWSRFAAADGTVSAPTAPE